MVGTGAKVLLLIFFMHASIYMGETQMDLGTPANHSATEPFISDYARVQINDTGNETFILSDSQSMSDYNITSGEGTIAGSITSLFNPLAPVWGAIDFLWGLITAPWTLYTLDMPWVIKLFVFAPLGILYLIALISLVRGFSF